MVFWLVIAALTVAALVIAFRPALTGEGGDAVDRDEDHEHDLAVYRHQLQELDSEEARGAISPAEAVQARNEVARRILAVEDRINGSVSASNGKAGRSSGLVLLGLFAVVFVPGLSLIVYTGIGSPEYESQPLAMRLEQMREAQATQSQSADQLRDLVARAEEHLRDNPDDAQGWDVLAPVYFRIGQIGRAETAYRNAIRLSGENPQRLSGLGEVLVTRAGGIVTEEAGEIFDRSLALDPTDVRGRFFDGLADVQIGRYEQARTRWQELIADQQSDPIWRMIAQQSLDRLEQTAPRIAGDGRPPELDADTISQMQDLSQEEQAGAIEQMVASLDERLRDAPDDIEGWKRLIRARVVLDQTDGLRDALERAHEVYSDRPIELADLRDFAAGLGLNAEEFWP